MEELASLHPLVGIVAACVALGVSRAGYYRAQRPAVAPKPRPRPARALSDEERARVLATLDSERFMDLAPAQVYAKLLEDGEYLCSTRTMYRVLAQAGQVRERRAQRQHPVYVKPRLVATAPNQVWTWDTTKLPGPTKGTYYTLHAVRHPRPVLPLHRRLAGHRARVRGRRARAHRRVLPRPAHHPRAAHRPRRPWLADGCQVDGAALPRPRRREEPQPTAHVERQPLLGVELPHAQVPTRHARPTRFAAARPPGRARTRRLVQRHPLPRQPRAASPRRRALRPVPRHHRGATACPRRGTSPSPGALRARPADPEGATCRGVDQPTSHGPDRERGSRPARRRRCSVNSCNGCLKIVDGSRTR